MKHGDPRGGAGPDGLPSEPDSELESALAAAAALHKDPRRPRRPTRYLARAILVPLGEALLEASPGSPLLLERVRVLVARDPEGWQAAGDEELTLAANEHVRSCDPKALRLATYDFAYTVAARHRLEARLCAMAALDLAVSERVLDPIERADKLLAPYLEREGR